MDDLSFPSLMHRDTRQNLSDHQIHYFSQHSCPGVRAIDISYNWILQSDYETAFANLPNLKEVTFWDKNDEPVMKSLAKVNPKLQVIRLRGCGSRLDGLLLNVANSLKCVDLTFCDEQSLMDIGFFKALQECRHMTDLAVSVDPLQCLKQDKVKLDQVTKLKLISQGYSVKAIEDAKVRIIFPSLVSLGLLTSTVSDEVMQ